jgi:hypothetical protein
MELAERHRHRRNTEQRIIHASPWRMLARYSKRASIPRTHHPLPAPRMTTDGYCTGAVCGPSQRTQRCSTTRRDAGQRRVLRRPAPSSRLRSGSLPGRPEDLVNLKDRALARRQAFGIAGHEAPCYWPDWTGCGIHRPPRGLPHGIPGHSLRTHAPVQSRAAGCRAREEPGRDT